MKKNNIFDTVFKIVLIAVVVVCLFMMFLGGGLRDKKPAASTTASSDTAADPEARSTDTLPAIDCECYPDSVVEDGYGTFYHHPGQDPEWTTSK